jgi:hypothetical protein
MGSSRAKVPRANAGHQRRFESGLRSADTEADNPLEVHRCVPVRARQAARPPCDRRCSMAMQSLRVPRRGSLLLVAFLAPAWVAGAYADTPATPSSEAPAAHPPPAAPAPPAKTFTVKSEAAPAPPPEAETKPASAAGPAVEIVERFGQNRALRLDVHGRNHSQRSYGRTYIRSARRVQ